MAARPRQAARRPDLRGLVEAARSDRPSPWIAGCDYEEFLAEIAARHGRDSEELQQRLDAQGRPPVPEAPALSVAGIYASCSHALSPCFRGWLIRGELCIGARTRPTGRGKGRADHLAARYAEVLPTGRLQLDGTVAVDKRSLRIEVSDGAEISQHVAFTLFPPSPPVSVLAGLMSGTTVIGLDAQPSATRVVLIRLPGPSERLGRDEAYVPAGQLFFRITSPCAKAAHGRQGGDPRQAVQVKQTKQAKPTKQKPASRGAGDFRRFKT